MVVKKFLGLFGALAGWGTGLHRVLPEEGAVAFNYIKASMTLPSLETNKCSRLRKEEVAELSEVMSLT